MGMKGSMRHTLIMHCTGLNFTNFVKQPNSTELRTTPIYISTSIGHYRIDAHFNRKHLNS